jgi:hypothetical protein
MAARFKMPMRDGAISIFATDAEILSTSNPIVLW